MIGFLSRWGHRIGRALTSWGLGGSEEVIHTELTVYAVVSTPMTVLSYAYDVDDLVVYVEVSAVEDITRRKYDVDDLVVVGAANPVMLIKCSTVSPLSMCSAVSEVLPA